MNNLEFYNLEVEIQGKMEEHSRLQEKYKKMTGVKFLGGQVISKPKYCDTCRYYEKNDYWWFCNCEESEFFDSLNVNAGCVEHDEEDGDSTF